MPQGMSQASDTAAGQHCHLVVHIKDHPLAKSWHIELIHLHSRNPLSIKLHIMSHMPVMLSHPHQECSNRTMFSVLSTRLSP